jgi:hypothetical protein
MLPEIERFTRWLRRKVPHASTPIHYASDLELFFAWLTKPPSDVKVQDIDAFIEHSQALGHVAVGIVVVGVSTVKQKVRESGFQNVP